MSTAVSEEVRKDILDRRVVLGESVKQIAEEYEYLTESEINDIIADIEQ